MPRKLRWRFASGVLAAILIFLFVLPIAGGLVGTLLPAFGYLPAVGGRALTLAPWRELVSYPGFWTSLRLTITTGLAATIFALLLAAGFCAGVRGRLPIRLAEAMLAPLLAAPHAAMAIGLAFLLSPSGWIVRLASPWLTGWSEPPDLATVHDGWGIALVLGLVVKEVPFLLLVILGALNQIPVADHLRAGRALGYARGIAWVKIVFPQVYSEIRLPVYVVLAYSLSVVDMALVLGPGHPAPLSVVALRWFTAPDITQYMPAAAAAVLQLVLVLVAIGVWRLAERATVSIGRRWLARGERGLATEPGFRVASMAVTLLFVLGGAALLTLGLWSFTWRWHFPDALPSTWSLGNWTGQARGLAWPLANTLRLGLATTAAGLLLAVSWLEGDDHHGRPGTALAVQLAYLPLLIPQIAFVFGVQVPLIWLGLDGTLIAVAWSQLLFVFPYMMISLADPWRALDPRYARAAAALGASPLRVLLAVKVPILLRPILIACAIGFGVSVAQYLPTLFAGNGRVPTLTTEAVTLASGADRRVVGVFAFLQSLLPVGVYVAAMTIPAIANRRCRGLSGKP